MLIFVGRSKVEYKNGKLSDGMEKKKAGINFQLRSK